VRTSKRSGLFSRPGAGAVRAESAGHFMGTNRGDNIILIGFMGCGKTTVGRLLARQMHRRFLDLDCLIARRAGMSINAIFRGRGEGGFRELEHRAVRSLRGLRRRVIAAGGGAASHARNTPWLKAAGIIVYLRVPPRVLATRLRRSSGRPVLAPAGGRSRALLTLVGRLLRARNRHYAKADITVDAWRHSPARIAREVAGAVRGHLMDGSRPRPRLRPGRNRRGMRDMRQRGN